MSTYMSASAVEWRRAITI